MTWKDAITLAIALFGAALSLFNTWGAIVQRRVRLRVRPMYAIGGPHGQTMFSIEVVNLSAFAVTITEVGFTLNGSTTERGPRAAVVRPIIVVGGAWPRRLEARESASFYCDPREVVSRGQKIGRAYAHTACGEARYGTSPALKQLREAVR